MKSQVKEKFGLRPDDVDEALGSRALRLAMVRAGWLKPVVQRHRLTIYDSADVARAWSRIVAGESPR